MQWEGPWIVAQLSLLGSCRKAFEDIESSIINGGDISIMNAFFKHFDTQSWI